jgi:hypothetical protein
MFKIAGNPLLEPVIGATVVSLGDSFLLVGGQKES